MTLLTIVALVAACAAALAGMIAFSAPTNPPPVPTLQAAAAVLVKTLGDVPKPENFVARDGTAISFRSYAGAADRVVVLVHGSSGSALLMHPIARELAKAGITAYALDIRGHGFSGAKGDIAYIGQIDDDVEDFLKSIAAKHPNAKRVMLGFSAGGGFTIRFAGGEKGELFDGYVAMAPYLAEDVPSTRPRRDGGWVSAAVPRLIALTILERAGIRQFGHLPVLGFAIPPDQRNIPFITPYYSYRLFANFRSPRDWQGAVRGIRRPTLVIAGSTDELFVSEKFDETFRLVRNDIKVEVVPNINHMQLVTEAPAIAAAVRAATTLLSVK
jgi:non-heme chloroperoxidase